MIINPRELFSFLNEIDIHYFYHANTVTTAKIFIEQGGLLSRGAVEVLGLKQTSQLSDEIDKKFNVWNDIFLDTIDLHGGRFPRQNFYGPVLFKIKTAILMSPEISEIWITRSNPTKWNSRMTDEDKYFRNMDEVRREYNKGDYDKMITLRFSNNLLPFNHYLKTIYLDNPGVKITYPENPDKEEIRLFQEAKRALRNSLSQHQDLYRNVHFKKHICKGNCFCHDNYLNEVSTSDLKKLFLPNQH